MLNDITSTLALLETRRSGRPREMVGPGPDPEELNRILAIAARTPDHGKLSPWRFVIVADNERDELALLFRQALGEHDPGATPAHYEKEEEFAHYPGALVVLVSAPIADHKIPVWEQQLSCGAAGMNLLLAGHALGYVGAWQTGWRAYNERVRAAFCGPGERIAGFMFIARPRNPLEERPRPALADVAKPWNPPNP